MLAMLHDAVFGMMGREVDEMEPRLEVFSACPASVNRSGGPYRKRIAEVSRWSERYGCRGMLIYADNRLVDPWMVAQIVVESTRHLAPLVAVQPAYMHPYTIGKLVATFAAIHGRQVFINWVAGGFKNDLLALADDTPHDARYDRLVEYARVVRQLTDGGKVTFEGSHYTVRGLGLQPSVEPGLRPEFMVSGSSSAGKEAARALGARAVTYALPPEAEQRPPCGPGLAAGLRMGIVARPDKNDAWRSAYLRFPPDREGVLMRQLANKVSDSHWHKLLFRQAEERSGEGGPYWMGPFENYKTMCPYLVGSYEEVADALAQYLRKGFGTFIVDEPETEADLKHARVAFDLAMTRVGVGAS
jgi:alkanesulfonate monooxygenase